MVHAREKKSRRARIDIFQSSGIYVYIAILSRQAPTNSEDVCAGIYV